MSYLGNSYGSLTPLQRCDRYIRQPPPTCRLNCDLIKSDLWNKVKLEFFPVSVLLYGSTTWTFTKRLKKKIDENYQKNACCFLQILGVAPSKTAVVWPLISHLTKHPSKMSNTCWPLRKKYGRTHKRYSPIHWHTSVGWPGKTNVHQLVRTLDAV